MANSDIKFGGVTVGTLAGRGKLYASVTGNDGRRVTIRIDDEDRPEFWAEVYLDRELLKITEDDTHEDVGAAGDVEDLDQ